MNLFILNADVQQYIEEHLNSDPLELLFQKSPFPNVSQKEIVAQIESKVKSKSKLPTWYNTPGIYYANKHNLSQCSSEITANYKAGLIDDGSLADLTGGFGVDAYAFSKKVGEVTYLEQNAELCGIATHNFNIMGVKNVKEIPMESTAYLEQSNTFFNTIYIDPSRRDKNNKKVYYLSDCEPDVTQRIPLYFSKANSILIKTGPLLDISQGIGTLSNICSIHIVAVANEVKEVLWFLKKGVMEQPKIKTVNFYKDTVETFNFSLAEEENNFSLFSDPMQFLYEPNAAILKAGAFKTVGEQFNLHKLHPNSHLYTSKNLVDFPGRRFKVDEVLPFNRKAMKHFSGKKANITTRNFPVTVADIRKKLNIKDGGDTYLFFTTNLAQKPIVIVSSKLKGTSNFS